MQEKGSLKIQLSEGDKVLAKLHELEQDLLNACERITQLEEKLAGLERRLYHSIKKVSRKRKKAKRRAKTIKPKRKQGHFIAN